MQCNYYRMITSERIIFFLFFSHEDPVAESIVTISGEIKYHHATVGLLRLSLPGPKANNLIRSDI